MQICPSRALTRDGDVLVFDAGACTACGRCRESAAPGSLTASGEFELAATDRAALVKRIPLLGRGRTMTRRRQQWRDTAAGG